MNTPLTGSDVQRYLAEISYKPNWKFELVTYPVYSNTVIYVRISRTVPVPVIDKFSEKILASETQTLTHIVEIPVHPFIRVHEFLRIMMKEVCELEKQDARMWVKLRGRTPKSVKS